MTTVDGDAGRIDEVTALVRDRVQPLIADVEGSLGLMCAVARDRGQVIATTAWSTPAARAASDAALAPIRAEAARVMGGDVQVRELELAVVERLRPAMAGHWLRRTITSGPPERIDEAIASFRDDVLPGLRSVPGFRTAVLLVDRTEGIGVATTTWDSREAVEASRSQVTGMRTRVVDAFGGTVVDIVEAEIVIAGIRTPHQHEASFLRVCAAMSSGGDLDDLDTFIASDIVEHAALPPGTPPGLAGLKQLFAGYREAFPDLRVTIERYLEQGDTACAVVRTTGTHTGPFLGAPATGRRIDISGIDVVRLVDGKAVEHWGAQDDLGMLTQLGLFSVPQQATTIELPSESRV